MKRKQISILFILLAITLAAFSVGACAKEKRSSQEIIEELTVYYATYGEEADEKSEELLKELEDADPGQAEKWRAVMELWSETKSGIRLNYDVLPDGLPDTDELCLIALGFQLNPDGTMKEELLERLKVLKNSAEKYPNALIVCTGGGTAAENKSVTEAGQMAKWLMENGIDKNRIIVEDKSITTAQNAILTYEILQEKYPQVSQLAIISSDYHIPTGVLLFEAEAILQAEKAGEEKMEVVSNAAYQAPTGSLSDMFQAGALIELSGDTPTAFDIYYEEYDIHELPPLETK